jgi:hypothetical protein
VIVIWLECVVVRNWDKMQIEGNAGNFAVRNAENKMHMYLYLFIYLFIYTYMCVFELVKNEFMWCMNFYLKILI